jgi:AraC family transcriptional regulator
MSVLTRILDSLAWIEDHLDDPPASLGACRAAGMSPYHYHRLFKSMTGMAPGHYIRRRILTRAAERLSETNSGVLDVALASGFESQAAFTRAFKEQFGTTPAQGRKLPEALAPQYQRCFTRGDIRFVAEGGLTLTPEMVARPTFSVHGFQGEFGWCDTAGMNALWLSFNAFLKDKREPSRPVAYGVCLGTTEDVWLDTRLKYMCGVEGLMPYDECTSLEIPAATYAVFTHRGDLFDIQKTIAYIWQIWIPRMEYELCPTPEFESYDESFDPATLRGDIKIWIPVSAASGSRKNDNSRQHP